MTETMTIRATCSCGARLEVKGSPDDALAVRALFATLHEGEGHVRTPPSRRPSTLAESKGDTHD